MRDAVAGEPRPSGLVAFTETEAIDAPSAPARFVRISSRRGRSPVGRISR